MQFRHLRAANREATTARCVDQLPGLLPRRILEGRAAGAALDRLRCLARLRDLIHLRGDCGRIAWPPAEVLLREDDLLRHAAMPIDEVHIGVAESSNVASSVDAARTDQEVLGLAPIGAAIHPQRAPD